MDSICSKASSQRSQGTDGTVSSNYVVIPQKCWLFGLGASFLAVICFEKCIDHQFIEGSSVLRDSRSGQ